LWNRQPEKLDGGGLLGPVRSGVWSNSVGNAQREVRGWGGPGDLFFLFLFGFFISGFFFLLVWTFHFRGGSNTSGFS
jgi:hypothetical protein